MISEDRLGLDAIYIQAKRWEGTVWRPEIQKFVGALHGKRARKGVFIASKVIAGRLLAVADPTRGRFRSFLIKALQNHTRSELRRIQGYAGLEEPTEDLSVFAADGVPLEDLFQCLWAQQVIRTAISGLEQECRERGRLEVWEVFRPRLAEPALQGTAPTPYEELVTRLKIETPRQAINLLTTANRMFKRHLAAVVASYAAADAAVEDELRDLRRIASGDGMRLVWGIAEDD